MTDRAATVEEQVVHGLESRGLAIVDGFLSAEELAAWRAFAQALRDRLEPARVGRSRVLDPGIRGDWTRWLNPAEGPPMQPPLSERMARLQQSLNRTLFLGLSELELHVAVYPSGACYAPHMDRLRGDDARVLSCIVYLNGEWHPRFGGALRLYAGTSATSPYEDILPVGGRLVVFLADCFLHEVKPPERERWSLTGWFLRRPMQASAQFLPPAT